MSLFPAAQCRPAREWISKNGRSSGKRSCLQTAREGGGPSGCCVCYQRCASSSPRPVAGASQRPVSEAIVLSRRKPGPSRLPQNPVHFLCQIYHLPQKARQNSDKIKVMVKKHTVVFAEWTESPNITHASWEYWTMKFLTMPTNNFHQNNDIPPKI